MFNTNGYRSTAFFPQKLPEQLSFSAASRQFCHHYLRGKAIKRLPDSPSRAPDRFQLRYPRHVVFLSLFSPGRGPLSFPAIFHLLSWWRPTPSVMTTCFLSLSSGKRGEIPVKKKEDKDTPWGFRAVRTHVILKLLCKPKCHRHKPTRRRHAGT